MVRLTSLAVGEHSLKSFYPEVVQSEQSHCVLNPEAKSKRSDEVGAGFC